MKGLIDRLEKDPEVDLDIVATAMHMEEKYGFTYQVIEADGHKLAAKIPLNLKDTSKITVTHAISHLQNELATFFENKNFDLIIILGDRYEMLAVANVALIYNIPICHLHGGEKTLGNFDEYIRHALTKMSHLHLASTEEYRKRIIQLGEHPSTVINTGSLGVENALSIPRLKLEQLEERLGVSLNDYYVVLFHPVTLDAEQDAVSQIATVLEALDRHDKEYIFIGSNSDTGSDLIMQRVKEFVEAKNNRHLFASLTTQEYHSLVSYSMGLIGNSSSGLIEVPSLNRPTLNIGDRQKGRLHGPSVIDVPVELEAIDSAINALSTVSDFSNPYMKAHASLTAYESIKTALKAGISTAKDFYDLEVNDES